MNDKSIKILLIEDDTGDADYLREILSEDKNSPFKIEWVDRLKTGLNHLSDSRFDIVLLDLYLPDSQGLDTFTKVRIRTPELPIIVLSGLDDETTAINAVKEGAQDYLVKGQLDCNLLKRSIYYAIERKQTEKKLKEETNLSRILLDNIPCVALLIKPETREIVHANEHALKVGAVPGKQCFVTWGKSSVPCPWCLAPELWAKGKTQRIDVEVSDTIWDTYWVPITKDLYLHYAFDITERKQAEDKLLKQQYFLSKAQEIGKIGTWELDIKKNILVWTDENYRIFGLPIGTELTYEIFLDCVHPSDREYVDREWKAAFDKKPYDIEHRLLMSDGSIKWVREKAQLEFDEQGNCLRGTGFTQDITARKQVEEELDNHRQNLEVLVKERTAELKNALAEVEQLKNRLQAENVYLQDEIKIEHNFEEIICQSKEFNKILSKVERVAQTDSTALVLGETGTGKELIARGIHNLSDRKDRPLVKVNCAAIPATLIESELFGHEKGAFTGAIAKKIGHFELADGGTIFLDEIGDLPLELQAKLLRVLQEGEFKRIGNPKTTKVDVRVIAATNRNLEKAIEAGEFRQDLYYRLGVFPINIPPLRKRKDDIPLLVNHFVNKYSVKLGKKIESIPLKIMASLQAYQWPGNVRELENIIERATILSDGSTLELDEFFDLSSARTKQSNELKTLKENEQLIIQKALEECNWVIEGKRGAASHLGIGASTLRLKIKKYGFKRPPNSL
jgi:PAS domain S-box-containing protein